MMKIEPHQLIKSIRDSIYYSNETLLESILFATDLQKEAQDWNSLCSMRTLGEWRHASIAEKEEQLKPFGNTMGEIARHYLDDTASK